MPNKLTMEIEHELFSLFRRTFPIHLMTQNNRYDLDRSTYSLLCHLSDEGPQRLSRIAEHFRLDASTITRQVQAADRLGLTTKVRDPADRRAIIVELTAEGQEAVRVSRSFRQRRLAEILREWSESEREDFLRGLRRFNATVVTWLDDEPSAAD